MNHVTVCVYGEFDPRTLEPANAQTKCRIAELGIESLPLAGKKVLDIGCNNGLVALLAARAGAAAVHAVDVNPNLVALAQENARIREASVVRAETLGFGDLDSTQHRADVVFFLEVLHWVVAQGTSVKDAVLKLWALTGETLVIEFPWSVAEPSIRGQTSLTEAEYSSQHILEWLTLCFEHVDVRCFNTYFQGQPGSCRALVVCSRPKVSVFLAELFPGLSRVERSVVHNLWKVEGSGHGPFAIKRFTSVAPVLQLPLGVLEAFLSNLRLHGDLLAPTFVEREGTVLWRDGKGGAPCLVYRWIDAPATGVGLNDVMETAYACSLAGATTFEQLDATCRSAVLSRANDLLRHVLHTVRPDLSGWVGSLPESAWSLGHGDVHGRNILSEEGRRRLLDFATFDVGLRGSDIPWALILDATQDRAVVNAWMVKWRGLAPDVPLEVMRAYVEYQMFAWVTASNQGPSPDVVLGARMDASKVLVFQSLDMLDAEERRAGAAEVGSRAVHSAGESFNTSNDKE